MVWEGKNVVNTGRTIIGATNPADSAPETIRGDFAVDIGRNVMHGSDSVESANKGDCPVVPRRCSRMAEQPSPTDLRNSKTSLLPKP